MDNKDRLMANADLTTIGAIRSNLCAEIVEYTSPDELAEQSFFDLSLLVRTDKTFDHQKLFRVTYASITKNLNQEYARYSVGCKNLEDAAILMGFSSESFDAQKLKLNEEILETVYFASLTASKDLAIRDGVCAIYKVLLESKNFLRFGKTPEARWDWSSLKEEIENHGLHNLLILESIPTESTSHTLLARTVE